MQAPSTQSRNAVAAPETALSGAAEPVCIPRTEIGWQSDRRPAKMTWAGYELKRLEATVSEDNDIRKQADEDLTEDLELEDKDAAEVLGGGTIENPTITAH